MPRLTKAEKHTQAKVDELFKRHGTNVQFNIFDLSKVLGEIKAAYFEDCNGTPEAKATPLDQRVCAIVAKYRQN